MTFVRFLYLVLAVSLSLYHSTLGFFNFLWLLVVWLAVKQDWLLLFLFGIVFDLVMGSTLGGSSLKFLGLAFGAYLAKEYWPQKLEKQLMLKI